jgi:acetyl esterase/lipase
MYPRLSIALLLSCWLTGGALNAGSIAQARSHSHSDLSSATVDTKRNAFVVHNLIYCQKHPSIEQTLDLYLPALAKPPYPLVIWVHGGTWMYGDKNEGCPAIDHLLDKYAVASVNYRLVTESPFPAQIEDVKAAVRFLRSRATTYKLDADRFGVWGESAGAHLAALLGTTGGESALDGNEGNKKYSSKVQAVCDWSGPTDFNTVQAQAGPNIKIKFSGQSSPIFVLMGGKMDRKSLAAASPVTYVSQDCPPFLIMHGEIDDAIPPLQSEELYEALKKAGCDAQYILLPGKGHKLGDSEHIKMVRKFFDEKLGLPKAK